MRPDAGHKSYRLTRPEPVEEFGALDVLTWRENAEADAEPRWPAGWWILPCAVLGLIECAFALEWLFAGL